MSANLPLSVVNNPRLSRWVRFGAGRRVHLAVGKVELGQGVLTALSQIAAEELDVGFLRISIVAGDTRDAPDEGSTASSQSIEVSGASVRLVMAEVRSRVLGRLALRLNCNPAELAVEDGAFSRLGEPTGFDYWNFVQPEDVEAEATGDATPKSASGYRIVGQPVRRVDLPAKLEGGGFVHDLRRPGMLHARILRQPGRGAVLQSLNEAALRRVAGGEFRLFRRGDFVAFVGDSETVVQRAAMAAPAYAVWQNSRSFKPVLAEAAALRDLPQELRIYGDAEAALPPGATVVTASYSRPYVAHAAIGPSCALAEYRDGHLEVWSHTQGVYPLRAALAAALGMELPAITVHHAQGPGCYGHNGADDVALDASVIAREFPNTPIRVQWRREDEFAHEPVSTAQLVNLRAVLDSSGRPIDWTAEVWAAPHVGRTPNGGVMLALEALPGTPPARRASDPPEAAGGGGTRNATPLYDIASKRIVHHFVTTPPIHTSSLRGLGALPNVFALEGFMDELALHAGQDPVAYRLSLMSEPRARRVIERAAAMANWRPQGPAGTGRGKGIAFSRYKNRAAYACVVVEVEVDREVRLTRVWCAADGGLIINPDGACNQVEGGILHGASMALKEQVRLGPAGVESVDWDSYPILRFSEVPEIEVELIDATDEPSLGMGECGFAPAAAAIGNAVAQALGVRIRDMPLSRERILAALTP